MALAYTLALSHQISPKRRRSQLVCSIENRTLIATCTGPTCKQSNSANILLVLQELTKDLDDVTVEAVGCLGECGNGPNIGISCTTTTPRIQTGVRTLRDAIDLLHSLGHTPPNALVEALQHKELGDKLFGNGDTSGAVSAYDIAITMLMTRPRLLARVLCNRSAALRDMGLRKEALKDANVALDIESGFAAAWKRKAEAHESLKEIETAVQAWTIWGRLAGKSEEASRKVRRVRGWRFAIFGG